MEIVYEVMSTKSPNTYEALSEASCKTIESRNRNYEIFRIIFDNYKKPNPIKDSIKF